MKRTFFYLITFSFILTCNYSCKKDSTTTTQTEDKKPVSESDSIQIPKYNPKTDYQVTVDSIQDWITFKELNNAITTIGADKYTKKINITRNNYLLWSEQFDNYKWNKKAASIKKDTVPSGTTKNNADGFVSDTTSAVHYVHQSYYVKGIDELTFSVYVKPGASNLIYLSSENIDPTEKKTVTFDLDEVSIAFIPDDFGASINKEKDGWIRCSITFGTPERGRVVIGATQSPSQYVFDGGNEIDFYLWGAQLENNNEPGTYISTDNAQESIEEKVLYSPNEKEKNIVNSSYLKLYYQVDDIYRRVSDVESKTIPKTYNIPLIKSRLKNLKTYALLLADAIKNNPYLTNEEINTSLQRIYDAYNSLLKQIHAVNDTSLEHNMEAILKRQ